MKKIEIVAHCYAKKHRHYADGLFCCMSSLVDSRLSGVDVKLTVCCTKDDKLTLQVLDWFRCFTFNFEICFLTEAEISLRAFGRNKVAKQSEADIVWFADVDQMYKPEVFTQLAEWSWPDKASLLFLKDIKISTTHALGDALLKKASQQRCLIDIDESQFTNKHYHTAIGGVQIVHGDFARKYGYLQHWFKNGYKGRDNPFKRRCRDDVRYRRFCGRKAPLMGIDVPGMYRIRHTESTHG